jgi:hypothetical protein
MRMPRKPGHITSDGRRWFAKVAAGQRSVRDTEHDSDEIVRPTLSRGPGVGGVAEARTIDRTTVGRRYRMAGR